MNGVEGLLETLATADGEVCHLPDHVARWTRSWSEFMGAAAPGLVEIIAAAGPLPRGPGLLRVAAWRETGEPRSTTGWRPQAALPSPLTVALAEAPRSESMQRRSHKLLDRGWVDRHARPGFFETLVWTARGGVLEGTRTNLWAVLGGRLVTPPLEQGLVPGVVRARILARRGQLGIDVRPISQQELFAAEALFLSGSGVGVVAVDQLAGGRTRPARFPRLVEELHRAAALPVRASARQRACGQG